MTNGGPVPDVVIIGGGVIGCSVAYFLAVEHNVRCLIIERNAIASEASGGAAGELAAVTRHRFSSSYTRFLLHGIELHSRIAPTLLEESGIDYLLSDIPVIRPAFDQAEADELHEQISWQRGLGMQVEWLDATQVRALGSWLSPDAIGAAYRVEKQLEAYPFALAMAQAAERHGVEIRTGEVTGIIGEGGRAGGVRLGSEEVRAQSVVVANGPWSQFTGEWLGLDIPVIPLRGQIVHLRPPDGMAMPTHAMFHEWGYVLPKAGGDLLVGTTQEEAGFDRQPTRAAQDQILESVVKLAPAVLDAPIVDLSACLRPHTRDQLPLIGAVPGWESLYLATGHSFKGITLALATGRELAELIVTGSTGFPIDEFSPARLVTRG